MRRHDFPELSFGHCALCLGSKEPSPKAKDRPSWLPLIAVGLALLGGPISASAASAHVRTLEGQLFSGELTKLDGETLTVEAEGRARTFQTADLLRADFAAPPRSFPPGRSLVLLANGDRLSVDPAALEGEEVVGAWNRFPGWPPVRIPLVTVSALAFHLPETPSSRAQAARAWVEKADSDIVFLRNGDRVAGQFQKLDRSAVVLKGPAGDVTIGRDRIEGIAFNPQFVSFPKTDRQRTVVTLADGSRLTARHLRLDENGRLVVDALFGGTVDVPLAAVGSVQFFGGRAVYLSDVDPAGYEFEPYLSGRWELQRDRSVAGGFLRLRGREYAKGLGMHSRSRVTYALDGTHRLFHATAGIDDSADGGGSAIFAVELDGERVFTTGPVTGRSEPVEIGPIDLSGKRRLTLMVGFGPRGDILDRANWCDAVLVRGR